jgi:hypothetical protein
MAFVLTLAAAPVLLLPNYCGDPKGKPQANTTHDAAAPSTNITANNSSLFVLIKPVGNSSPSDEQAQHRGEEHSDWMHGFLCELKFGEWVTASLTLLLVVVTAALAVYTFGLWGETKNLAGDAAIKSEKELRAYVMVESIALETKKADTTLIVTLKNYGNTPATKVRIWGKFSAIRKQDRDVGELAADPEPIWMQCGAIAPTGTHAVHVDMGLFDGGADIEDRRAAFYFWGCVEYNDGFQDGRWSRFQMLRRGPHWLNDGILEISEHGNTIGGAL